MGEYLYFMYLTEGSPLGESCQSAHDLRCRGRLHSRARLSCRLNLQAHQFSIFFANAGAMFLLRCETVFQVVEDRVVFDVQVVVLFEVRGARRRWRRKAKRASRPQCTRGAKKISGGRFGAPLQSRQPPSQRQPCRRRRRSAGGWRERPSPRSAQRLAG